MLSVDPKQTPIKDIHGYLLGGIAPRPIALVSTVSADGARNLAPFSFFNAFSANPPVVVFSPARRLRDATVKDTYINLIETKECVIQAVTYDMSQQINLASADFDAAVDEFVKSGLTPVDSEVVKPPRVKESPYQMECKLQQMIPLGEQGAAGNLALCEVVRFHIDETMFDKGVMQPDRLDLVARMGGAFYCRTNGASVFQIPRPIRAPIGFDGIPEKIRRSTTFTGNDLAQLAGVETAPNLAEACLYVEAAPTLEKVSEETFYRFLHKMDYQQALSAARSLENQNHPDIIRLYELAAQCAIKSAGDIEFAWNAALYAHRKKL